jgi:hypothetical protein
MNMTIASDKFAGVNLRRVKAVIAKPLASFD